MLQTAIENGDEALVANIIKCNLTNVMMCGSGGICPLHTASKRGQTTVLSLLLQQLIIDVNQFDNEGQTALHVASETGQHENVKIQWCHHVIDVLDLWQCMTSQRRLATWSQSKLVNLSLS